MLQITAIGLISVGIVYVLLLGRDRPLGGGGQRSLPLG